MTLFSTPEAEALIDAMAHAFRTMEYDPHEIADRAVAAVMLRVVLKARSSTVCETCGGKGRDVEAAKILGLNQPCPACDGSGTAQGPRLITQMLMEQVAPRSRDGKRPLFVERGEAE